MPETTDADKKTTQSKKPYSSPTLVEYGDIAKLTQGRPSGRFPDGMSAMFRPTATGMCL
ncbi:MAG: lasso RiPP family leader peptide-containing protein [Nitrospira sp.]|nr:lasso RiPP family leader peptide-containing protein [Nitrospira sp.]